MDGIIEIDRRAETPVYVQIADAIGRQIRAGERRDGERLPSERMLASMLGVNRTTVVNAYDQLASAGLVVGEVGRGTLVRAERSSSSDQSFLWGHLFARNEPSEAAEALDILLGAIHGPVQINLASASADERLIPIDDLSRLCHELLEELGPSAFSFPEPAGTTALRAAVSQRFAARGVEVGPDQLMITAGAQQGISLLAEAFLDPGDTVAVDSLCYSGALAAFQARGARLVGIPSDADGIRVDALQTILERHPVSFVFLSANFSNPSGSVLSDARRIALLDLTHRYGVPVVDDDVCGDLALDGSPPRSLRAETTTDHLITLQSLSKPFSCGIRVGWIAGPEPVIRRVGLVKPSRDLAIPRFSQELATRILTDGLIERHLAAVIPIYRARRDALYDELSSIGPALLPLDLPRGGYSLWATMPGQRARSVLQQAAREGVMALPGDAFAVDVDASSYVRLSFGIEEESQLRAGARHLAAALDRLGDPLPSARHAAPMV